MRALLFMHSVRVPPSEGEEGGPFYLSIALQGATLDALLRDWERSVTATVSEFGAAKYNRTKMSKPLAAISRVELPPNLNDAASYLSGRGTTGRLINQRVTPYSGSSAYAAGRTLRGFNRPDKLGQDISTTPLPPLIDLNGKTASNVSLKVFPASSSPIFAAVDAIFEGSGWSHADKLEEAINCLLSEKAITGRAGADRGSFRVELEKEYPTLEGVRTDDVQDLVTKIIEAQSLLTDRNPAFIPDSLEHFCISDGLDFLSSRSVSEIRQEAARYDKLMQTGRFSRSEEAIGNFLLEGGSALLQNAIGDMAKYISLDKMPPPPTLMVDRRRRFVSEVYQVASQSLEPSRAELVTQILHSKYNDALNECWVKRLASTTSKARMGKTLEALLEVLVADSRISLIIWLLGQGAKANVAVDCGAGDCLLYRNADFKHFVWLALDYVDGVSFTPITIAGRTDQNDKKLDSIGMARLSNLKITLPKPGRRTRVTGVERCYMDNLDMRLIRDGYKFYGKQGCLPEALFIPAPVVGKSALKQRRIGGKKVSFSQHIS